MSGFLNDFFLNCKYETRIAPRMMTNSIIIVMVDSISEGFQSCEIPKEKIENSSNVLFEELMVLKGKLDEASER